MTIKCIFLKKNPLPFSFTGNLCFMSQSFKDFIDNSFFFLIFVKKYNVNVSQAFLLVINLVQLRSALSTLNQNVQEEPSSGLWKAFGQG